MRARAGASILPVGAGIRATDRLQHLGHAFAGLGGDPERVRGLGAEQVGDLLGDPLRLGAGEVDLVDHRDQLEPVFDRQVGVGDGLRLDPLGGVDDQQGALAGGEAAADLVGEVDVAGRVDQVQVVGLAVVGLVLDPHGLGLDRDPALPLEVHRVEQLRLHFFRIDRAGELQDAVGERRLAVVDVGDDREVANLVHRRAPSMNRGGVGRPSSPHRDPDRPTRGCRRLGWSQVPKAWDPPISPPTGSSPGRAVR